MLTPTTLEQILEPTLGKVLTHLGDAELPDGLDARLERYGRIKSERGRAVVAQAVGLKEAELPFLDAALRDVERTRSRLEGGDEQAERNAVIAMVRLLSWLETVGQRVPELALDADVETLTSEELGRKQVRALELIVRSLINESYGDQEQLTQRLRDAMSEKAVQKWQQAADQGDILSGLTFSELASLFVNKEEFARYETLYEDTPFLTLLKQRRRTIQTFLDDVRRVRNTLAHNKKVTNVQLSLLDLYYEEIVTPVQDAYDEGETKVDPETHLDVPKAILDGYYETLREDVQSVKDDLGELRSDVMASLGDISDDTQAIRETTKGIDKKILVVGAGVLAVIVLAVILLGQGGDTQESVEQAKAAAERTEEVARTTDERVEDLDETAKETAAAAEAARDAAEATQEVAEDTHDAATGAQDAAENAETAADAARAAAEATKEVAEDTKDAVEAVQESNEKVVQTLEELRNGFAALTQTGGIIQDAKRPQEHYHNARLYEQRGDVAQSMASYRAYFSNQDLEFVDPHLRFQKFLKLQNGQAGARETYFEMKQATPNLATEFAWTLLLPDEARVTALETFLEAHPDYAPAWYALSRDYSLARLGSQAMADKREEKRLLTRFLELEGEGAFLHHYLDQAVAAKQIEDAKERLAALSTLSDEVMENPVRLTAMFSSSGWNLVFTVADVVKEYRIRVGEDGPFESTGFQPGIVTQAGLPLPKMYINLPKNAGATTVYLKYVDPRDKEHGPFALEFDPVAQILAGEKQRLDLTKDSWIQFGGESEKPLLLFSNLLVSRSALKEVRYGLDTETPDTVFTLPPLDPANSDSYTRGQTYLWVPKGTRYATVQLTFADGTESEVLRFER